MIFLCNSSIRWCFINTRKTFLLDENKCKIKKSTKFKAAAKISVLSYICTQFSIYIIQVRWTTCDILTVIHLHLSYFLRLCHAVLLFRTYFTFLLFFDIHLLLSCIGKEEGYLFVCYNFFFRFFLCYFFSHHSTFTKKRFFIYIEEKNE